MAEPRDVQETPGGERRVARGGDAQREGEAEVALAGSIVRSAGPTAPQPVRSDSVRSEQGSSGAWDRRSLLGVAAAASTLIASVPLGCAATSQPSGNGVRSGADVATTSADAQDFDLAETSLSELLEQMSSGARSARQITELYLERIARHDRQGIELRSVIETNPEALQIAEELDQERARGTLRGALHGIPILLKDNIATADRNTTTAGSLALAGSIPERDSFVARRLRAAGAVLLGKANLSEWANFRSNDSSSGWSARGGQCRNPFVLDRNPCGSSSGSAAATSASFCAAAIGTETNGSIVCPSSACGLVEVKPTVGLVSRTRIVPIAETQDTAGPMTRTVHDAALVLGALVGIDAEDPATSRSQGHSHTDYTQFLVADGLRGKRIGVYRETFGFDRRVDAVMEVALTALREAGAEVIDPVELPGRRELGRDPYTVLLYEFKAGLNAYLSALGDEAPVKTLAEVIAFNEAHAERELPYFGQDILLLAEEKGSLEEQEYRDALANILRLSREEGIDKTMAEHRLDAIAAPTGGAAWLIDLVHGDSFGGGSSSPAAIAGYPNVTVPAGFVSDLPVGISFFGRAWSEPTLLAIAYGFEQTTQHRRAPEYRPVGELLAGADGAI